jgi:hypothetical protein
MSSQSSLLFDLVVVFVIVVIVVIVVVIVINVVVVVVVVIVIIVVVIVVEKSLHLTSRAWPCKAWDQNEGSSCGGRGTCTFSIGTPPPPSATACPGCPRPCPPPQML